MREGEKAGWQRRESGVLLWPVQRCERTINSARWGLRTIRRCLNLEGAAGLCEFGGCACLVVLYFQAWPCRIEVLSSSSSSSSSSPSSKSMCKVWWNGIRWVSKSMRVPISIDFESAWMTGTFPRRAGSRDCSLPIHCSPTVHHVFVNGPFAIDVLYMCREYLYYPIQLFL